MGLAYRGLCVRPACEEEGDIERRGARGKER